MTSFATKTTTGVEEAGKYAVALKVF